VQGTAALALSRSAGSFGSAAGAEAACRAARDEALEFGPGDAGLATLSAATGPLAGGAAAEAGEVGDTGAAGAGVAAGGLATMAPDPEAAPSAAGADKVDVPREANQAMVTISTMADAPAIFSMVRRERDGGGGSGAGAGASRRSSGALHW